MSRRVSQKGGRRMSGIDERNPAWEELLYVLKDIRDALQQLVNER